MKRFLAAAVLFLSAAAAFSHPEDANVSDYKNPFEMHECETIEGFPTQYNEMIRAAWLKNAPIEWAPWHCYFLGQLILESGLNPDALSHADAAGFAQLLKTAERDCQLQAGMKGNRWEVVFSINCAVWLMRRNGSFWISERSDFCRIELALVSYISGAGNPIKAQKVARNHGRTAVCYFQGISKYMSDVVSQESADAANFYVERISSYGDQMTSWDLPNVY